MTADRSSTLRAQELAKRFHEAYERLAPQFGYETRQETRRFDADSPNGRLMVAVCAELLADYLALVEQPRHETRDKWLAIESAPKDGTWFLGWDYDGGFYVSRMGPGLIAGEDPEPTHWMPLPAPPKETA